MNANIIELPALLEWQRAVVDDPARFKVVCVGRRAGKSQMGVLMALAEGLSGGRCWIVLPTFPLTVPVWRVLKELCRQLPGCEIRESTLTVLFTGGGFVTLKSADAAGSLRGEGLSLVIVDEAALIGDEAIWFEQLRPALADRRGKAIFISTPAGAGSFFHRLFLLGLDPLEPDWHSWQLPTSVNPLIAPEEIEAARKSSTARVFGQEWLAEWNSEGANVFRNVRAVATAAPLDYALPGHSYSLGADFGRSGDFTVTSVFDLGTGAQVALDRYTGVPFEQQVARMKTMVARFRPLYFVAEANNFGQAVIELLQRQGVAVEPFITTNATKQILVDKMTLAFEQQVVKILPDEVQIGEFEAYREEKLPAGGRRFAAPGSGHDDCVIAGMLAWSKWIEGGPVDYSQTRFGKMDTDLSGLAAL